MSETTLFFTLAGQTLRDRCRWAAITLLLTPLIPYEVVDNKPQFLWQLISELPLAGAVAALAPLFAGVAILIASLAARRSTSLAMTVLASLATASALFSLGADASAWGLLALPENVIEHPASVVLALALTAAGVNLAQKPQCKPFARRALAAASALLTLYYLMPARGRAPLFESARLVAAIFQTPYWRVKVGFLFLSAIALAPAILVGFGIRAALRPSPQAKPLIGAFAVYGLPAILIVLLYRSFFGAVPGAEILGSLGAAVLLAGVLAILASSFEVLGEASVTPDAELALPSGFTLRRAALIAAGASALVCVGQAALARPPVKGVTWTIREPSASGNTLFGELLPAWNDLRERRDVQLNAELEANATSMINTARALDPGLGRAIERLTRDGVELHVAGRRFYSLIEDVNEASRAAGLPYYLDPSIGFAKVGDGLLRRFQVLSYRVDRVHTVHVGERPFTALHVRAIGGRGGGSSALGFSRDIQPFALVNLDALIPFAETFFDCAPERRGAPRERRDIRVELALESCTKVFGDLGLSDVRALELGLAAMTERHEIQHQIDGPHLPLAAAVAQHLPGQSAELSAHVNRELSAYIAALTTEEVTPKLGVLHLFRFALLKRYGVEHHVALIAFSILRGDVVPRAGAVDVDAIRDAFLELTSLKDGALRARAAQAWRALYGSQLATPR